MEDEVETVLLAICAPGGESPPPTIIEKIEEMFLRLSLSQTVAMNLVDNQGIVSTQTQASLSDEEIATICDVIRRPSGLLSRKMPDRRNQISVMAAKNLNLAAFMFKSMEHCSKAYHNGCVNSASVLKYQHQ